MMQERREKAMNIEMIKIKGKDNEY